MKLSELAGMVAEKQAEPPRAYSQGLFGLIDQLTDTVRADADISVATDPVVRRHAEYHYIIVAVA